MADKPQETSTPGYSMGYSDGQVERLRRNTAETQAPYLLPYLKPGMRLLDIGCGPGTISAGLASAVEPGEFHGIDMNESQVELATAAAGEAGLSNTHFQAADALNLPFPNDYFDAVHCRSILIHIPDTTAVLTEIKRVLKSGGVVGAREAILDSIIWEPDIAIMRRAYAFFLDLMIKNGGHIQMGKELRARFSEAGFVDVEASGALLTNGSQSAVAEHADDLLVALDEAWKSAISDGIASMEEQEQWREALGAWKNHPGAFAARAVGDVIGRKP